MQTVNDNVQAMSLDDESDPAAKGAGPDLAELLETVNDGVEEAESQDVRLSRKTFGL